METFTQGKVVRSRAGRDQDRFFVVLKVEGDFARIADGSLRKLAAPKRKRLRHLAPTAHSLEEDSIRTDKQLRRLLTNYNQNPHESECDTGGHKLVKK